MTDERVTVDDELVLDGNAAAGVMEAAFGVDVTAGRGTCGHCRTVSLVGALRAYVRGPGIVLRCPACTGVVIRIAETPAGLRIDRSGLADLDVEPRP